MTTTTTTFQTLDQQREMHAILASINAREAGDAIGNVAAALASRAEQLTSRITVEQPSLDDLNRTVAAIEEIQSLCDNYLRTIRHHREGMVASKAALDALDAVLAASVQP